MVSVISPPTAVALTLENVVRAVERVRNWRETEEEYGLGWQLCVPDAVLDEIERNYSTVEGRVRGVVEYWWQVDPSPSWRRIICALDWVEEYQLADEIRHNAEPLTGMLWIVSYYVCLYIFSSQYRFCSSHGTQTLSP